MGNKNSLGSDILGYKYIALLSSVEQIRSEKGNEWYLDCFSLTLEGQSGPVYTSHQKCPQLEP